MDKVFTSGLTAENMKENTLTTRNMDLECIHTQMGVLIKDSGLTENSTVKAHSSLLKVPKEKVSGKKEKESNGSTKRNTQWTVTSHNMTNDDMVR